jgi:ubiquinone/menaquinone biosynthesis C-methylase UbiE
MSAHKQLTGGRRRAAQMRRGHLPAYDALLSAYHAAFGPELECAVRDLPLPPRARVLDAPCGGGFYTACFARRLGRAGAITAADLSDAYLARAKRAVAAVHPRPAATFVRADVYHLPFEDASFDAAWCAQSFISLDDPAGALRQLRRVVRPGGVVAVLETDEFHHVLLPWPVGLELVVQKAVQAASQKKYGRRTRLYPGRYLRRMLTAAGLRPRRKKTYAADRQAPFDPGVRRFLELHMHSLTEMIREHLTPDQLSLLDRFVDPDSAECLYRRSDADVTCLNSVYVAER